MVTLPRARNSVAQRVLHRSLTSAQWQETRLWVYQGCQYHSGGSSDMGVHTMVTSFPKYLASSLNHWWIIVASGSWSSATVMSDALAKVITTDASGNALSNPRHPHMFSMLSWRTSWRRGSGKLPWLYLNLTSTRFLWQLATESLMMTAMMQGLRGHLRVMSQMLFES